MNHLSPDSAWASAWPVETLGLRFPNPVGLAAGYDRNGAQICELNSAGFGFIEIGTINFDSVSGSERILSSVIRHIKDYKQQLNAQALIGISLGSLRNEIDTITTADYLCGMEKLFLSADYMTINLSRPGSDMRLALKDHQSLSHLLEKIRQQQIHLTAEHNRQIPLLVKVAISYESRQALPEILWTIAELGFNGLLVAFENWPNFIEIVETVNHISELTKKLPLVIVGGIKTADHVIQTLDAGASLVQCYTLLSEAGPAGIKEILRQLAVRRSYTAAQ